MRKISLLTSRLLAKNLVLPVLVCTILLAAGAATDVHAFRIRRANSNLCLDGWSGYGNSPRLATCDSGNLNQQWSDLVVGRTGGQIISNLRSQTRGLCLDAYSYVTQGAYALPYFAPCDQSNFNQRWTRLPPAGRGEPTYIRANNVAGQPALDGYVRGDNFYPYLISYGSNNTNQQWYFE